MPPHPDSFYGRLLLGVIDKLVLGVFAAVIVILFQTHTQDREDRRQQLIEAARLESQFIDRALKEVNRNMDEYYQVARNIIRTGRAMKNEENSKMAEYEFTVERSLFLIGKLTGNHIIQEEHKGDFQKLKDSMADLHFILSGPENDSAQRQQRQGILEKVQENHAEVLRSLREAALEAVRLERDVAVTKEPVSETDQAE